MQDEQGGLWRAWQRWLERQARKEAAQSDDPEALLQQAQEQMRQAHERNRELAVQAITQKNNIQQMLLDTRRKVEVLTEQANAAELRDDLERAILLRHDANVYREAAEITERQLQEAEETVEQVKRAIQADSETLWCKTAEALSLRVQWRAVQIERELARWEMERTAGQESSDEATRYLHHRKLLVEAIVGKNQLAQMTRDMSAHIEEMSRRARYAETSGSERLATHLLRALEQHEATLARVQAVSERAEEVVERAQQLLDAEYESLRAREIIIPSDADSVLGSGEADETKRRGKAARLVGAMALCLLLLLVLLIRWR